MLREAQAFADAARLARRLRHGAAVVLVGCTLAGCASGGMDLSAGVVDETITTASVPSNGARVPDGTRLSDEVTIRNAVTSADVETFASSGLSWANADTGSRGAVTSLSERKSSSGLCRRFTASRESFDGVALYRGETCLGSAGWRLLSFDEI